MIQIQEEKIRMSLKPIRRYQQIIAVSYVEKLCLKTILDTYVTNIIDSGKAKSLPLNMKNSMPEKRQRRMFHNGIKRETIFNGEGLWSH